MLVNETYNLKQTNKQTNKHCYVIVFVNIFPLPLVRCEILIVNSALRDSLANHHVIFTKHEWKNRFIKNNNNKNNEKYVKTDYKYCEKTRTPNMFVVHGI